MRGVRRWADRHVSTSHTSGPQAHREAAEDDGPFEPPRMRLGFTPPPRDVDPLLWEGDDT